MDHLVRTFAALRLGAATRRRLHARVERLRALDPSLRVPAQDDLHVTLHFLGNTPSTDLARIGRALLDAATGVGPLEVAYRGLGAFPDAPRARVVWAGVLPLGPAAAQLDRLVGQVGLALGDLGYPPERRRFHAHVTLARTQGRPRPALVRALEAATEEAFGTETLSEMKLILSDPGGRPYHYIDLTTVELGG